MSKSLRMSLIVIAIIVGAAALVLAGFGLARSFWGIGAMWPSTMMARDPDAAGSFGYGPGMGMMGSGAYGPGMGMMGGGMMGATGLSGIEPLTLEQAEAALDEYLNSLGDDDLTVGEIMIFDNHAYAEIVEASTGIGALEVLVDPVTLSVYPEHGPNMMWNLKHSPMAGYGGMMGWYGGRGRWSGLQASEAAAEMPVGADQAVNAAQEYLDRYLPGAVADEHVDPFYGYYTLHILRDGETVGMLSVNGYSAQVFLHSWHGDFIEMSEE